MGCASGGHSSEPASVAIPKQAEPSAPTATQAAAEPPPKDDAISPEARAAFEKLKTAERFDSTHIGEAGILSQYVEAFRVMLALPEHMAGSQFRALYATASPEGKLYALSGLYFTDSKQFATEVARLANDRTVVKTMNGCILMERPIAEVVRFPSPDRMKIPKGRTLWSVTPPGPGDIAGGVVPLAFLESPLPAPTDPL
jgi:hypothetical protein